MFVYRVELKLSGMNQQCTHVSPYNNTPISEDMREYINEQPDMFYKRFSHEFDDWEELHDRCPPPSVDKILCNKVERRNDDYFYGFESIEQLCKWFNRKEREALNWSAFYVSVYDVDNEDVVVGDKQVIFKIKNSQLVNAIFLGELQ